MSGAYFDFDEALFTGTGSSPDSFSLANDNYLAPSLNHPPSQEAAGQGDHLQPSPPSGSGASLSGCMRESPNPRDIEMLELGTSTPSSAGSVTQPCAKEDFARQLSDVNMRLHQHIASYPNDEDLGQTQASSSHLRSKQAICL